MEEIHGSVKHFKFDISNLDIILSTKIKASTKLFFKRTQDCWISLGREVPDYSF